MTVLENEMRISTYTTAMARSASVKIDCCWICERILECCVRSARRAREGERERGREGEREGGRERGREREGEVGGGLHTDAAAGSEIAIALSDGESGPYSNEVYERPWPNGKTGCTPCVRKWR